MPLKKKYEELLGREIDPLVFEQAIEHVDSILAIREQADQPTSDNGVDRLIKTTILLIENGIILGA